VCHFNADVPSVLVCLSVCLFAALVSFRTPSARRLPAHSINFAVGARIGVAGTGRMGAQEEMKRAVLAEAKKQAIAVDVVTADVHKAKGSKPSDGEEEEVRTSYAHTPVTQLTQTINAVCTCPHMYTMRVPPARAAQTWLSSVLTTDIAPVPRRRWWRWMLAVAWCLLVPPSR
jgi:hypothetical protein